MESLYQNLSLESAKLDVSSSLTIGNLGLNILNVPLILGAMYLFKLFIENSNLNPIYGWVLFSGAYFFGFVVMEILAYGILAFGMCPIGAIGTTLKY